MESTFNSIEYVKYLANDLVSAFNHAGTATTPVLVGLAKEKAVIKKLEMLLPQGVGVGSGCIIDSYGNTSRQCDIVIYEKELCPVFCINESPETTYYPCEGVIAAGEVKASLSSNDLENAFQKSKSVKQLKRYSVPERSELFDESVYCFRSYLNTVSVEGTPEEGFHQAGKTYDQICFFVMFGTESLKKETIGEKFQVLIKQYETYSPNLCISLHGGLMLFYDRKNNRIADSYIGADVFIVTNDQSSNFEFLLKKLHQCIHNGRTVPVYTFTRYFSINDKLSINGALIIDIS